MKRILFFAGVNMFTRTGGGLATLAYYNALCCLFPGQVDLITPEGNISADQKRPDWLEVGRISRLKVLFELITGRLCRFADFTKRLLEGCSKRYDLCDVNGGFYAGAINDVAKAHGLKTVVIHHNFEKDYHIDNRTIQTFYGLFPWHVSRNERKAYLQADLNLFLTRHDMNTFSRVYGLCRGSAACIGCFEPESSVLPETSRIDNRHKTIVISGAMNIYQTICSIKEFCRVYLPVVRDVDRQIAVVLAGKSPGREIMQLAGQYPDVVSVIPDPVDIDAVTGKGSIYCCPTNLGSGLKLRLMDGLRLGMPILVHDV
jgi:hypothetical protein